MNDDYRISRISYASHRDKSESHSKTSVGGVQCQTSGVDKIERLLCRLMKKIHLLSLPALVPDRMRALLMKLLL
jgi:hypothetical protein